MHSKLRFSLLIAVVVIALLGLFPQVTSRAQNAPNQNDTLADGTSRIELPDGTVVSELADRTVTIALTNQLTLVLPPDDRIAFTGLDQQVVKQRTTMPPGEMSNGTRLTPSPDGAVRIDLPDGSVVSVSADNTVEITPIGDPQNSPQTGQVICTFTATRTTINLRAGPGTEYEKVDAMYEGDTLGVTGQATGNDGYIWWESDDVWVRSDMGDSDCPATCGNDVCEYGEDADTCALDCTGTSSSASSSTVTSTGDGCLVDGCQSCYESVSCYPECSDCDCWNNEYGCATCYCSYTETSESSCVFETCEECIAAFPCFPDVCTVTDCSLNEYGCPVCSTAP